MTEHNDWQALTSTGTCGVVSRRRLLTAGTALASMVAVGAVPAVVAAPPATDTKSVDWIKLGSQMHAVAALIYAYGWGNAAEAAERARLHKEILDTIKTSASSIKDLIIQIEIAKLKGEVTWLIDKFEDFDPDPSDKGQNERLRAIIDDSENVLGRMSANIGLLQNGGEATNLALESVALSMPLVFLRVQAMVERQKIYGSQDVKGIPRALNRAVDRLSPVPIQLRAWSDARFGPLIVQTTKDPGPKISYYAFRFNNMSIPCFPTRVTNARAMSEKNRRSRMDAEYAGYRGGAGPAITRGMERMRFISKQPLSALTVIPS